MKLHPSTRLGCLAMVAVGMFVGAPASAEPLTPFLKDEYHLKQGGTPPEPSALGQDPMKYLRSESAYRYLLARFSDIYGVQLNDQTFAELMSGADVQLVPCLGKIQTTGLTSDGAVGKFERDCYTDEKVLQLRTKHGWTDAAAQGCYNASPRKKAQLQQAVPQSSKRGTVVPSTIPQGHIYIVPCKRC